MILTEALCKRPWQEVVRGALAGGADCIQLREKEMPARDLWTRAEAVLEETRAAKAALIVDDRPDVGRLAGAEGVHLGQEDLPVDAARGLFGASLWYGASTQNLAHAEEARRRGTDYCGVGPMYASDTKRRPQLAGLDFLRAFRERFPEMPHLAIGGITADNAPALAEAGARGIAVTQAVCGAEDPEAAARALRHAME